MSKAGIVIQGTKDGFNILYVSRDVSKADQMSIGYDIRRSSPSGNAIGKECYALSFSPGGKVYTIYRAMYDGLRNMAVGFLGISLFIPFDQKADGGSIKRLLDILMKEYLAFTSYDKLGADNEDWGFVDELLQEFESWLKNEDTTTEYTTGTKNAAYVYYKPELLSTYFEEIFQSQYKSYRQILLLDEACKSDENILLAIKHSDDLTEKLDIRNPVYMLCIRAQSDIEVMVNNGTIKDGGEVSKEKELEIAFMKKYHETVRIKGTCNELANRHKDIFSLNHLEKKITVKKYSLEELEISVPIKITTVNNKALTIQDGIMVNCINKRNGSKSIIRDGSISFVGEEIGQTWSIQVDGGKKYRNSAFNIIPELQQKEVIRVQLQERRKKIIKKVGDLVTTQSVKGHGIFTRGDLFLGILIIGLLTGAVWTAISLSNFEDPSRQRPLFSPNVPAETNSLPEQGHSNTTIQVDENQLWALIDMIEIYAGGTELDLNRLNFYGEQLEKADTTTYRVNEVYSKIKMAIAVRNAINSGSRNDIDNAFAIDMFSPDHKRLFRLIKKNNNIDILNQIEHRAQLTLRDIEGELNEKILAQKPEEVEPGNKEAETKAGLIQGGNNRKSQDRTPNYTFDQFIKIVKSIDEPKDLKCLFDQNKLNGEQKILFDIINYHFGEFMDIPSRDKLSGGELIKKIKEIIKKTKTSP
jgi:hypothetical protein